MMKPKVLKTETDYQEALACVETLMDAQPGSPEVEELELFSILIEKYEKENYPIDPPEGGMIRFTAEGTPVPKQSFRAVTDNGEGGKKVHGYTDPRVKAWQETVTARAREAMQGRPAYTRPVLVVLVFRLPTARRVDCDNLSKAVLDAIQPDVIKDDAQVIDLHIIKLRRCEPAGVTVTVEEVESEWEGL